jgi:hypothetical protein
MKIQQESYSTARRSIRSLHHTLAGECLVLSVAA